MKLLAGISVGIIGFFLVGYLIAPHIIYDHFLWKYFWGPIVSDAVGHDVSHNGVVALEKYTIASEIIYGLLIAVVLYSLYSLLSRWNIKVNGSFFFAVLPYVVFGSVGRVLEDAHFFSEPLVYWFISPLIYVQIVALFLVFFIGGHFISKRIDKKRVNEQFFTFIGGMILLVPSVFFMLQEILQKQNMGGSTRLDIFIVVSALVSIVCLCVYLVSYYFKGKTFLKPYKNMLNLAMLAGHMLDGFTSWISIYDPFNMGIIGYYEKHPASNFLMETWPPLFPITKFLLIIFVIYMFDVIYKEDLYEHRRLVNLLKIGIFILGFAPGLRDLLRVMMGV
jgi:uncharacterized membrane protein